MFRTRKEDSLFDTDVDTIDIEESATVISASTAATSATTAAAAPAAPAQSAYTPANNAAAGQPQPQRPIPSQEGRAAAANPPSFRPNASAPAADLQRSRLPEAKAMNAGMNSAGAAATQAPVERPAQRPNQRVLTVGNDILLKGEIATCDRLVIEGKVDATLNDVHTVEIAQSGSFKGSAHIEDAEISGLFEGDLVVKNRLVIYATGKVRGKITYGEIEIERGGELTGEIKTVAQAGSTPARKTEKAAA